jgi:hypothetical protein
VRLIHARRSDIHPFQCTATQDLLGGFLHFTQNHRVTAPIHSDCCRNAELSMSHKLIVTRHETMSNDINDILTLIARERRLAVSDREWQHRLRGYGYAIRDTDEGRMVTSLVRGAPLCAIPAHVAA